MSCTCTATWSCPPERQETVNDRHSVTSFLAGNREAARSLYAGAGRGTLRVSAPERPRDVPLLVMSRSWMARSPRSPSASTIANVPKTTLEDRISFLHLSVNSRALGHLTLRDGEGAALEDDRSPSATRGTPLPSRKHFSVRAGVSSTRSITSITGSSKTPSPTSAASPCETLRQKKRLSR